jgi:hypothetical protein
MTEKFEKIQVIPRGSSDYFILFKQKCKTYHFLVKSILKNASIEKSANVSSNKVS